MPSWRHCDISGVTVGVVVGEIGALLEVEKVAEEADLGKLEMIKWSIMFTHYYLQGRSKRKGWRGWEGWKRRSQ